MFEQGDDVSGKGIEKKKLREKIIDREKTFFFLGFLGGVSRGRGVSRIIDRSETRNIGKEHRFSAFLFRVSRSRRAK